jgi:GT2 family glycosyltransferase
MLPVLPGDRPAWAHLDAKGAIGVLALLDYGEHVLELRTNNQLLFGANIAFSRAILSRAGLFDTSRGRKAGKLFSHEETHMQRRILELGGKIVYQPMAIVNHVIPRSRLKKSYSRNRIHVWQNDPADQ